MSKNRGITAMDIMVLLETRHGGDVFVPECKAGATQGAGYTPRLDAWVMFKSRSRPRVIGYEVKVSRSDFDNVYN